ncbi:helix-turn-helix domain-containing protein [Streptomyces sp. WAC06614]|uniref:helix-turn-helix domain-containing protein n=1 Tax=Streptomyces sp. WAC06614 TaxID=2487416 RepID=UPI000F7A285E|nr:helix-turn-helix domain-containing protein [Streptomyces sp. WAC06614]RSS79469.1 hypothetical protein EF918_17305 [Streptomyces sp. WAC06614]
MSVGERRRAHGIDAPATEDHRVVQPDRRGRGTARQVARRLGRSASTVSREIARDGGRVRCRAAAVDAAARERSRRREGAKLARRPVLRVRAG